ncbi:hypothetical protein D3Z50_13800 [Clostridiaceae bacterium]|nr:hypothetical protein [Clostridiaceae bacterium]
MDHKSKTSNVVKNISTGIMGKVFISILTFVERKIFIQFIGVEILGLNGLFSNILQILSIADLGLSVAMGYSYYEPIAHKNTEKIAALTRFYSKLYNVISAMIFLTGMLLLPFLKYVININKSMQNLYVYYILYLINIAVSYLLVYSATLLAADQKGYIVNSLMTMTSTIRIIVQIVIVIVYKNYSIYLFVAIGTTLLNNILLYNKSRFMYPYIKNKEISLTHKDKGDILLNLKSVFIYKVSGTLLNSVDTILISSMIGTAIVGYYANYQMIVMYITQFVGVLFSAVTAGVGNYVYTESNERRYELFDSLLLVSFWLSATASAGVLCLSSDFIGLWLGKDYVLGIGVSMAIAFNLFFVISMQPVFVFREAVGLYQKTKWIMLIAAAINLVLSVVLGKKYGLSGIIIATIIARLITYFWYEPRLLYKMIFGKKAGIFFVKYFTNVFVTIVCIVSLELVLRPFVCSNLLVFIIKIFIVILFVSFIYIILNYRKPSFKWVLTKLKYIFKREKG